MNAAEHSHYGDSNLNVGSCFEETDVWKKVRKKTWHIMVSSNFKLTYYENDLKDLNLTPKKTMGQNFY